MKSDLVLGITILSTGGRTIVPRKVMEVLKLEPTLRMKEKILWIQEGDEIIVEIGTPQSSYRKTKLGRGGKAAVPKHIREALKLKSTLHKEERIIWIRKGNAVVVRKGTQQSSPTD